jgi:hypothetical protein
MSVKTYRKRPVAVQAMQWADEATADLVAQWCDGRYDPRLSGAPGPDGEDWGALEIETLEGSMEVSPYDYVICGIKGEFYPCKPDIFEATYELLIGEAR